MGREPVDYRKAGVDAERKERAVEEAVSAAAVRTFRAGVIPNPGGFAGLFALEGRWRDPVLVACTDGVGTKIKIAILLDRHDTVGIDLVAMSVNDLIVTGAEPLFFLDYVAMGRADPERIKAVIAGVAAGCERAGCALLGGETAEMPGMYQDDDYDLAGFAVGAVERDRAIDGTTIVPGDALIGIASSGVHSNGYSLVRKVFLAGELARGGATAARAALGRRPPGLGGRTLGDVLLEPTRIYAPLVRSAIECFGPREGIKGIAHITGGGIPGNLPRILPPGVAARVDARSWPVPPIFDLIEEAGPVARREMFDVFNMGIGLVLVVPRRLAGDVVEHARAQGEAAHVIGEVVSGEGEVDLVGAAS